MKRFTQLFAVVLGVWSLVALCNSAAIYLLNRTLGGHEELAAILRGQFTDGWIWAALTPIVFLVSRRFPLNRKPIALHPDHHALNSRITGFKEFSPMGLELRLPEPFSRQD